MAKDKKITKSKVKVTKGKESKSDAAETAKAEIMPKQNKADNEQASDDSLAKDIEAEEKPTEGAKEDAKSEANPSAAGTEGSQKKISGLIFMCNSKTKGDCFQYRVFGLPEGRKEIVEQVSPGMKLFLFDADTKLLHGLYLATSRGSLNLEPQAFTKVGKRGFPAQVRFRTQRECLPLTEDVFKPAIKENYIDRNKFKFELNAEQVKKLTQLFRSAPRDAGKVDQQRPPQKSERLGYEANAIRGDGRARREFPPQYNEVGYRGIPDYLPVKPHVDPITEMELRRLEYAREVPLVPADPYQDLNPLSYYRQLPRSSSIPDIGQPAVNPDLELEALYRHRLQMYSDPRLERALGVDPLLSALPVGLPGDTVRKRTLDEAFVDDRALLVPKRPHVQDDLLYRELEYQRAAAAAAADQRLVTKYYAGGLR